MFVAKQDLKSVPLQLVFEKVMLAVQNVEHQLVTLEEMHYNAFLQKKEKEWSDTHEAPFEGNFSDIYPYVEPDPEVVARAKIKAKEEALTDIIFKLGIKAKSSWFLPQMTAYIAKMELPKNSEGLIDPVQFRVKNFGKDDWHKGLWMVATVHQRGLIVPSQTSPDYKQYSAIVPLLMMPFKKFDRIPYSAWSREGLRQILDPKLIEVLECTDVIDLPKEEILAIRAKGLAIGSGAGEGTSRNAVSFHQLYKIKDTPIGQLPWLCQVMATQIWAAHPVNRLDTMILDWLDWDKMPEAIITSEVRNSSNSKVYPRSVTPDLPWDC